MAKVLIVEDHASMRESLTTALTAAGDFSVVGEVPNADYALDFCRHLHPDLVLMDLDALSGQWHDGCNPGIRMVCVNGAIVHENGRCTGLRPGSVLLKNGAKRG